MTAGHRKRCQLILVADERRSRSVFRRRYRGVWLIEPWRAFLWDGPRITSHQVCGGGYRIIRAGKEFS